MPAPKAALSTQAAQGANENTNGLLCLSFAKANDLSRYTRKQLEDFAIELNGRPRQTVDWMTPSGRFAQSRCNSPRIRV
jgi:IS30 family transposase